MAAQAGLCLAWSETLEDTFCRVVAHLFYDHIHEAMWEEHSGRYNPRYEPQHDKTNKMSVRPAKTQISLDIRPVRLIRVFAVRSMGSQGPNASGEQRRLWSDWSESSLGAHVVLLVKTYVMLWLICFGKLSKH